MWETQVQFLDWEDPLEKGIATHSSILAWRIPWTEGPVGLQFLGLQKVWHDRVHFTFTFYFLDQEMPYNWKKFFLDNLLAVWPEIFNKLLWVSVSSLMFLIKKKKKEKEFCSIVKSLKVDHQANSMGPSTLWTWKSWVLHHTPPLIGLMPPLLGAVNLTWDLGQEA